MGTESRISGTAVTSKRTSRFSAEADLERLLFEDPTGFSFFQAMRLLLRLHPERARVGQWADPAHELARFSASTSLGFPASEIESLTAPGGSQSAASGPPHMVVNFFGLTGPQGVMPHVYSEHAGTRARVRDTASRDFFDIFNHRAISLLYRAWEKQKAAIVHESGGEDRLFDHLLDLGGVGTAGLRGRIPIPDEVAAFYSGLLANHTRSADGLSRLVGDYFEVPASVEQFVGEWRRVDHGGQSTMGADDDAGRLGFGVLGDAVWDPQARVRLRLGPLTRAQFNSFIPGGSAYQTLRSLARVYSDELVGVDAQLVLARREVPPCTLDVPRAGIGAGVPPALGRGTWLASRPLMRDPDETTLRLC